jgi:hypothetical protein
MAKYARTMSLAVGDLKPSVIMHVFKEGTEEAEDFTNADSVDFFLYDLENETLVIDSAAASFNDRSGGILQYDLQGDDTTTAGRYVGYFVVYWSADDADPMTTTGILIDIKEAYRRLG